MSYSNFGMNLDFLGTAGIRCEVFVASFSAADKSKTIQRKSKGRHDDSVIIYQFSNMP
jgi:hypothetical protein